MLIVASPLGEKEVRASLRLFPLRQSAFDEGLRCTQRVQRVENAVDLVARQHRGRRICLHHVGEAPARRAPAKPAGKGGFDKKIDDEIPF